MRRYGLAALTVIGLAIGIWLLWPRHADLGNPRFFADQTYNFETIRVLNDIAVAGGDTGETLQAIAGIRSGDPDSWYRAWKSAGDQAEALAGATSDQIGKGRALLRAHNYYREAEFFLSPHDSRRPSIWTENLKAFYDGLDALGVKYNHIVVPYGEHHLHAIYYPGPAGSEKRPLLVMVGGYDSTMEELYFSLAAAAYQRGYSVLTYEGPGQGSVIRDQGLTFTPEWERPNGAVLDTFLSNHAKPPKIVLIGESLGGYLAPRAAAFDSRIDGVVAYDAFFDGGAIAARHVPKFVFWLRRKGYYGLLNLLAKLPSSPGSTWAQQNGMWVLGVNSSFAILDSFKAYSLAPVAARIKNDVLIFGGADDHFVPVNQIEAFKKSLTKAHSVTTVVYDRKSGGAEHCQLGVPDLWQPALFDWLNSKFSSPALNGQSATLMPTHTATIARPTLATIFSTDRLFTKLRQKSGYFVSQSDGLPPPSRMSASSLPT